MNIVFMGGHELGKVTLEHLIQQGRKIVGVVVSKNSDNWYKGVDEIAKKYELKLFEESNINNAYFLEQLKELEPDLIVVVNFEKILKKDIISLPTYGCINTHASLLPKYRGRAPLNWAIINGEKETGVTVHKIDKGIDTGDIIEQERINIKKDDYIEDVLVKVKNLYPYIVDRAISKIQDEFFKPIKQNIYDGFYLGKRTADDGKINWKDYTGEQIYNLIRAVSKPYPGAFTLNKGSKLIIWKAELIDQNKDQVELSNGTILISNNEGLLIKSKNKNIMITEYEIVEQKDIDLVVGDVLL